LLEAFQAAGIAEDVGFAVVLVPERRVLGNHHSADGIPRQFRRLRDGEPATRLMMSMLVVHGALCSSHLADADERLLQALRRLAAFGTEGAERATL
jgi:hypothetical protein